MQITLTEKQLETAIDALRDREDQTLDMLSNDVLPMGLRRDLLSAAEDYRTTAETLEAQRA